MAKLTLNLEASIVEKAKQLAEVKHTNVSAMFTQFVESASAGNKHDFRIGPLTRKLSGIIDLPPCKSDKVLIAEALSKKHGNVQ